MKFFATPWEVSVIILGLAVLLLLVFAVPVLIQVRRTARSAGQVLELLNREVPAILRDLRETSANIQSTADTARSLSRHLSASVEEYRSVKRGIAEISRLRRSTPARVFASVLPAGQWLTVAFGLIRAVRFILSPRRKSRLTL